MADPEDDITQLVERWGRGDEDAFDRLIELVYPDLRQIAHRHLRMDRPDHTIDTTALVHEAYLKLAQHPEGVWHGRSQFFNFRRVFSTGVDVLKLWIRLVVLGRGRQGTPVLFRNQTISSVLPPESKD